jgi:hypothetical protein
MRQRRLRRLLRIVVAVVIVVVAIALGMAAMVLVRLATTPGIWGTAIVEAAAAVERLSVPL